MQTQISCYHSVGVRVRPHHVCKLGASIWPALSPTRLLVRRALPAWRLAPGPLRALGARRRAAAGAAPERAVALEEEGLARRAGVGARLGARLGRHAGARRGQQRRVRLAAAGQRGAHDHGAVQRGLRERDGHVRRHLRARAAQA